MSTSKVVNRDQLRAAVERLRSGGKTIVFTNGCFDLLHVGHIRYLQEARRQGDALVLGLNGDGSVRRLKGPRRPIVPEAERAEMLAALECVDYVCIFDEDTPDEIIRIVAPDVHVKGGDYRPEDLPEAPLIKSLGGRIVMASLVNGRSTTITIGRILESHADLVDAARAGGDDGEGDRGQGDGGGAGEAAGKAAPPGAEMAHAAESDEKASGGRPPGEAEHP